MSKSEPVGLQEWFEALAQPSALIALGVLHGQVGGVFSGGRNLINSPRVLVAELQAVFGALANLHQVGKSGLAGWRDMVRGAGAAAP